jgi:flagellar basal body-associated protein FliL
MQYMQYVLASSDPLAPWGQAAAIIMLFYFLIVILLGLGLTLGLMFGLSWVREKTELIKKLRPTVESINTTTESAIKGNLPASIDHDNRDRIVQAVVSVPARAHDIEQKVEQGSDRVASGVIEFRARTQMAKGIVKAFFLPGLTHKGSDNGST